MRKSLCVCAVLLTALSFCTPSARAIVAPYGTSTPPEFWGEWAGTNWTFSTTPVVRWSGTSAVSISADTVLMAAHCDPQVNMSIGVAGNGPFLITSVTSLMPYADLVVCKISKPQLRWAAPYGGPINAGPNGTGDHVELIGCGYAGTCYPDYCNPSNATSRVKRWCTESIDSAGSSLVMYYHAGDTALEGVVAGSDSGGGTFIKTGDYWRSVGIITNLIPNAQDYTVGSVAVNLADPTIYKWLIHLTTLPGDTNFDNKITFADYLTLEANFGKTTGADYLTGDFNFDGKVTFADYLLLEANFGKDDLPIVPEPATLSLLALAGLGLITRRK